MPRKSALEEIQTDAPSTQPRPTSGTSNVSDKLDQILLHLERMDRRDQWRTRGAFVRSIIGLLPIALTVLSIWYLYNHGDELLQKIAAGTMNSMTEQLNGLMPRR